MFQKIKKILGLAIVVLALFVNAAFADDAKVASIAKTKKSETQKTRSFYVKSREPYLSDDQKSVCRQVARILDEPENKKFSEIGFIYGDEFVIPKKFSDFSLPIWEDVKREDLDKYVKSETWMKSVRQYEEKHPDPKEKLIIQKTTIDLDNDGTEEVVLRFGNYQEYMFLWGIFVSDIVPTKLSEGYAAMGNKMSMLGNSGNIFKYRGKTYEWTSGFSLVAIRVPVYTTGIDFGLYDICFVGIVPAIEKKIRKKWDNIEQEYKSSKNHNLNNSSSTNN